MVNIKKGSQTILREAEKFVDSDSNIIGVRKSELKRIDEKNFRGVSRIFFFHGSIPDKLLFLLGSKGAIVCEEGQMEICISKPRHF